MLYVEAEKPVTTKHPVLGDISFKVEVPQAESTTELTTVCGGDENLLGFANGSIATNSKNAARAEARNYEVPKDTPPENYPALIEQLIASCQATARGYSPSTDADKGPSKAKKAQAFDQLAALAAGGDFTKEQLFAILAAAK